MVNQAPPHYTNVDGALVETDALRIAERVHEYDSNLSVKVLASAAQQVGEPPFVVVERCRDGIDRPVFSVWKLDEAVLQRLYAADNEKWNVLAKVDSANALAKEQQRRRYRESMDEAKEIVSSVLKSPKSTYTVPESVTQGERGNPSKLIKFKDTR